MIFSNIEAYTDLATRFQNEANTIGAHRMYSDKIFKVVSQNYGREGSAPELELLCRDVLAFKLKVLNTFSAFYTSKLFTLKHHLLDRMIETF